MTGKIICVGLYIYTFLHHVYNMGINIYVYNTWVSSCQNVTIEAIKLINIIWHLGKNLATSELFSFYSFLYQDFFYGKIWHPPIKFWVKCEGAKLYQGSVTAERKPSFRILVLNPCRYQAVEYYHQRRNMSQNIMSMLTPWKWRSHLSERHVWRRSFDNHVWLLSGSLAVGYHDGRMIMPQEGKSSLTKANLS